MYSTVCSTVNDLKGWHYSIPETMSGSRRISPAEVPGPATMREQPSAEPAAPAVETVFIADPRVADQTIEAAESWGLTATTFPTGGAVLEANIEHQKGCLITELRLPDMSGIALLEELKARSSILPVVVLTAHPDLASAVRAVRLGALAVLEKPCSEPELSAAIREAIAESRAQRDRQLKALEMRARMKTLNRDEAALVELILGGMKNNVIARRTGVSLRTVENRRRHVYEKMGADCIADLVQRVLLAKQTW